MTTIPQSQSADDGYTYFLDISGTVEHVATHYALSGIQRVVLTLAAEMAGKLPTDRLYLSWCDRARNAYRCVPYEAVAQRRPLDTRTLRRLFHRDPAEGPIGAVLGKYRRSPIKYLFHRTRFDLAAMLGFEARFKKMNMDCAQWKRLRRRGPEQLMDRDFRDVCRPGDHLIQLDMVTQEWQKNTLNALRDVPVKKYHLIHDLIPLETPEFVSGETARNFWNWMNWAVGYSDFFLTNSNFTHEKLTYFSKLIGQRLPIRTLPLAQARLPLGTQVSLEHDPTGRNLAINYPTAFDLDRQDRAFTEVFYQPFVLCVGTIEARKNVRRIAMAWKAMFDAGHRNLPTLVFAGHSGHMPYDFVRFLEGTGDCYGLVKIISSPSDKALDLLYRKCLFTVQVSLSEGWGLSVGESLAYGKTAVVSRTSSLPEVGGDLVTYCAPEDVDSIADSIQKLLDPQYRRVLEQKIAETPLRSWSDVADDLLFAISNQSRHSGPAHPE